MASTRTRTKQIRIANETYDYFVGKPLNRMAESLHHLIESGVLTFDGEEIKIVGGVNTEKRNTGSVNTIESVNSVNTNVLKVMADIEEIALLYGVELEDLAGQFCEMLNDGTLTVDSGVLKVGEEK